MLFDECYVKGNKIFVSWLTYASKEDRDKERSREEEVNAFISNLREKSNNERQILYLKQREETALTSRDTEKIESLISLYYNQEIIFYENYLNIKNRESTFKSILPDGELEKLGFKQEWIDDPIYNYGVSSMCVGEYKGEIISHELFYNRLKKFMYDAIIDC